MTRQIRTLALAGAATVGLAAGALAHSASSGGLQVVHPWVEPAKAGADTTAHPTLVNKSEGTITLTRVTSRAARSIQMIRDGQVAERVEIASGATLPAERFALSLRDLTVALPAGKAVPVTFHRADGASVTVKLAIGQNTMDPETTVELPS
ncbi:hypothetical protein CKO28_11075 [Rhodovibrio sodomensis]|uniref:Copper chaperone PCu(A)C n=1 Tax=Rhodovibrio sodomensis TaxID=1088 RepID=A0ABS1DDV7_9PROT|nr:copper chaperone PCu(A)C [Rhodovibrio sodomensis]MBK1668575.1 hypothetical protein [Rhodovibrio sodomensis]